MSVALTQHYAEFIGRAATLKVPPECVAVARLGFTDCAAAIIAGRDEDVVRRLRHVVAAEGAAPVARLTFGASRAAMNQAALVNATASHALDYDDFAFSNHPSAVLVPTILAAAESSDADGRRMATAYVVGYEIWSDLMAREPDHYYDRGWHPTAVLGPIGAAAAAAVVLGLGEAQARDALALAASSAGGVFENFGTMAKPWHGGRTAAAGLSAALLARAGIEASPTALEGRHGLLGALSPKGRVDRDTPQHLGERWRSAELRLNIKRFPIVGAAQRAGEAMLALRGANAIDPARVRAIRLRISERHAAVAPFHQPHSALQAKFSLEFALACALARGRIALGDLSEDCVRDPTIRALMARVSLETTSDYDPAWRDAAPFDQVWVTLDDGTTLASPPIRRASGHADRPLSTEQLWAKFLDCAAHGGVAAVDARALFEAMQRIDALAGTGDIPVIADRAASP